MLVSRSVKLNSGILPFAFIPPLDNRFAQRNTRRMAGRTEVTMKSTYRGDLSKRLREDKQKLDAFQKWLDRSPLRVPARLDLSGGPGLALAINTPDCGFPHQGE